MSTFAGRPELDLNETRNQENLLIRLQLYCKQKLYLECYCFKKGSLINGMPNCSKTVLVNSTDQKREKKKEGKILSERERLSLRKSARENL